MNGTPNYDFKLNVCGVNAIDEELRRVEDLVDLNAASIADTYNRDEVDQRLDGKVDKQEGCRLICEGELDAIQEQLGKKVDMDNGALEWNSLELQDFTGFIRYAKDSTGLVFLNGILRTDELHSHDVIARIPEGFRPQLTMNAALTGVYDHPSSIAHVFTDGRFQVGSAITIAPGPFGQVAFTVDIAYKAMP